MPTCAWCSAPLDTARVYCGPRCRSARLNEERRVAVARVRHALRMLDADGSTREDIRAALVASY